MQTSRTVVELTELLDRNGQPAWTGEFGPPGGTITETDNGGTQQSWRYVESLLSPSGQLLTHRYRPVP